MAKPPPAEEETAALRRRLRRLVATITAGGAGAEAFDEAAAALAALREAQDGGSRKGARGEETRSATEAESVPAQFLCPISSKIMRDPVVVESGQVRTGALLLLISGCSLLFWIHHCVRSYAVFLMFF